MTFQKIVKVLVFLPAVFLFSAHIAWPESPVLLRYRFQPGQTLNYRIELKSQGKMSVGNIPEPVAPESVRQVNIRFLTVDPAGNAVIEARYAEPQNRIKIGAQPVPQAAGLPESTVSVVRGRISPSGFFKTENASPDWNNSVISPLFPELPSVAVPPGFSWIVRAEESFPAESPAADFRVQTIKKYTYLGAAAYRGNSCLKIVFESRILLPGNPDSRQKTVKPERFSGQGRGEIYLADGRLIASEQESTTESEYVIPAFNGSRQSRMVSRGTVAGRAYLLP